MGANDDYTDYRQQRRSRGGMDRNDDRFEGRDVSCRSGEERFSDHQGSSRRDDDDNDAYVRDDRQSGEYARSDQGGGGREYGRQSRGRYGSTGDYGGNDPGRPRQENRGEYGSRFSSGASSAGNENLRQGGAGSDDWHLTDRGSYGRGSYGGFTDRNFNSFTGNDFGGRDFSSGAGAGRMGGGSGGYYGGGTTANRSYGSSQTTDEYGSWRQYGEERGFFEKASDAIMSLFGDEDAARRRDMDHSGRGPSNYKRSDERICEDANDRLTHDPAIDATHVTVSVDEGELTLNGTVNSRQAKRRAEDVVDRISGVKHVQNNLRVDDKTGSVSGYASTTGASGGTTSTGGTMSTGGTATAGGASSATQNPETKTFSKSSG